MRPPSLLPAPPSAFVQSTLFGSEPLHVEGLEALQRVQLNRSSWIDVGSDTVHGSDKLSAHLHRTLP